MSDHKSSSQTVLPVAPVVVPDDDDTQMGDGKDAVDISSESSEEEEVDRVIPLSSFTGKTIPNPPHKYSLRSANNLLAPSSSSLQKGQHPSEAARWHSKDGSNDAEGATSSEALRGHSGSKG